MSAAARALPAAGARNRRFTLHLPVESSDGFGGVIRTFQPGPLLWGALETLRPGERQRGDRAENATTHRIITAWRAGVEPGAHLTLGLRRFRVTAATDGDGGRRVLHLLCEEVAP